MKSTTNSTPNLLPFPRVYSTISRWTFSREGRGTDQPLLFLTLFLLAAVVAHLAPRPLQAQSLTEPLTADQIMARAVEHSKWESEQIQAHKVTYTKTYITEELASNGQIEKRSEENYTVEFQADRVRVQLLGNSSEPPDESGRRADRPLHLTTNMIAKFDFILVERGVLNGRETFLLAFAPKPDLADGSLPDRFLNRLAGWVWIDAQDFAVAQARIRLLDSVGLWGGMLGALKRLDYVVERVPIRGRLWFNRVSQGTFEIRKLLVSRNHQTRSEWRDIQVQEQPVTAPDSTSP